MKTLQNLKEYSWAVTLVLLVFVLFRQCGVNKDVDRIEKSVKLINQKVDSIPSGNKVKQQMNEVMFDFLIYEDDFDKKKTSLSDIKQKIQTSNNAK
jgi:uncharacterized protein YoxC